MPSPVAHSLAGVCGFMLVRNYVQSRHRPWLLVGSILIANLPDFDLIPVLLLGKIDSVHRQWTHSLPIAAGFALLVGRLARWTNNRERVYGIWAGCTYVSHIVLDMLLNDPSPPRGVQLLWPFSDEYFISSFTPFSGFRYRGSNLGISTMFFEPENIATMAREALLMAPIVCAAAWIGRLAGRKQ